ncbi:NEL-type E3 ubiquitin ligase domain-containing protein [Pseudomonas sp. NPDC089554]|uniref:NEL-type E3 ubiquitin ligase domain-containing protein n=1 Tax=Pseudomonas sp. NPDC089554 TaxID=3390653 RepID=UPI003D00DBFC
MNDLPLSPEHLTHPRQLIAHKLPEWLVNSTKDDRQQMRDALVNPPAWSQAGYLAHPQVARALVEEHGIHRQAEAQVRALLESLPELLPFATQLLTETIKEHFGLELDVTTTYLINAPDAVAHKLSFDNDPIVDSQRAIKLATQSLLHCALQNFEASHAQPGGLDVDDMQSVIVDSDTFVFLTPTGNPLAIDPAAFAARVRELDIGGRYKALVDALKTADSTLQILADAERSALRLHLHQAYLSQAIDTPLYHALLTLAEDGQADYLGSPLRCAFPKLFDAAPTGALLIGAVPSPELLLVYDPLIEPYKGLLVTYFPGAPTPLKAHGSVHEVQAYLREQLSWQYLHPLVPERDKQRVLDALRAPDAWVAVTLQPLHQPLFDELASQKLQRLEDDALFHAVPTASEDRITAEKRRAFFTSIAFNALNLGAFVIPGLGATLVQLGYEVYEGLESWAEGDRRQGLEYLMDVIDNVALTAALAAVGDTAQVPAIEVPARIDALTPIELANGETRLWHPDLRPFSHDIVLPADLQPDASGLYHHEGKTWLALDGNTYAVQQHAATGRYPLQHPLKAHGYAPELRHNGAGAWLHELDRPRQWSTATLFQRAGHLTAGIDEASAQRILQSSGIDSAALRKALNENQRLPALLEDTLQRFALDREVRQALDDAPPSQLRSAFEQRYSALPKAQAPGAQAIQQRYPQLPSAVADELARNANATEQELLTQGKIPLRLAEETRAYQQQVRLARAYEGLHLGYTRNWDSDRLLLRTLEQLPGWPQDLRLELEQCRNVPYQTTSAGPESAPQRIVLASVDSGYLILELTSADSPPALHETLSGALFEALTAAQRRALAIDDETALQRLLEHTPALPRETLREVLGMRPIRPGYRSPMRLADGRLGYPLSGAGATGGGITRRGLLAMIRQSGLPERTPRSASAILAELEGSGLGHAQIDARLRTLLEQRQTLQTYLSDWQAAQAPASEEASSRLQRLATTLMQHWYDHALPELGDSDAPLRLEGIDLTEFPRDLPEAFTSRVAHLQLVEPTFGNLLGWGQLERQITSFFQQFPEVRALEVTRPYVSNAAPSSMLFALPLIAHHLPELEALSFTHQNLPLSSTDIDSLAELRNLRRLDLSGNHLSQTYPPRFDRLMLDYLGLERMSLEYWPSALSARALERFDAISLRGNQIRLLPHHLLNDALHPSTHPTLSLEGNPILDAQLEQVLLREDGRAERFNVDISDPLRERLAASQQRRQQLRDALDDWSNASSSTAPLSEPVIAARRRIGSAVLEFWRQQERGILRAPLRSQHIALEHFPQRLPAFFNERVRNLVLTRASGSTAQLESLFARFPNVTRLEIEEHQQPENDLPSAALRLPALSELELPNLHLEVDQAMLETFGRMSNLVGLNLAGNRAGTIVQAPETLRRLTLLDLSNMGLTQWPDWVDALLPLPVLNLSDNLLTELPEHILSNLHNQFPVSSISLFGNPLSSDVVARARASSDSQHSFTFAMDLPEDLQTDSSDEEHGHLHAPVLPAAGDEPNLQDWLHGAEAENEALQDNWQQLEQAGDAGNLLALVGRLRQSGPYRNTSTRGLLCQRVRKVLLMAVVNSEDRMLFNALAEEALVQPGTGSQTCHDGVLLVFQNIELVIANRQMLTNATDSEDTFYRELRRLFRLQELDRIAREKARQRDEAEVRLAYRQGLNDELALGVPDDDMLYRVVADVNHSELNQAVALVRRSEQGETFLNYAASNADWTRYLRHTHAERFEAIEQQYQARVNALPDQHPDLPLEALAPQFEALEEEKRLQDMRLVHELTILANPDRND